MSTTPLKVVPLLSPDNLDELADNYELAAAIAVASNGRADWPQTLNDLLTVAFALRYLARCLRERGRL
jgi:hypothetical protein